MERSKFKRQDNHHNTAHLTAQRFSWFLENIRKLKSGLSPLISECRSNGDNNPINYNRSDDHKLVENNFPLKKIKKWVWEQKKTTFLDYNLNKKKGFKKLKICLGFLKKIRIQLFFNVQIKFRFRLKWDWSVGDHLQVTWWTHLSQIGNVSCFIVQIN